MYYWRVKNINKNWNNQKFNTKKFDNIVIVGGILIILLAIREIILENQLKKKTVKQQSLRFLKLLKKHPCKITFPEDVLVGKNMDDNSKVKELTNIEDDDLILDIGPKTIKKIKKIIETSKTILWNGPAGYFENPNFAEGSYEIANAIVKNKDNSIYSVVGGGDTIALINQINVIQDFNFVSTAGGAFLEYLEGKELPGIKALN